MYFTFNHHHPFHTLLPLRFEKRMEGGGDFDQEHPRAQPFQNDSTQVVNLFPAPQMASGNTSMAECVAGARQGRH